MNDDDIPEIDLTAVNSSNSEDYITITIPDDLLTSTIYSDTSMASSTYSNNGLYSGHTISTVAASGNVLTANGTSGVNWGTITFSDEITSNNIHIGGENPKLTTDRGEVDLNDLAGVVEAVKQILDTNELPIFDRAFRDKHEILQKAWEDIKQAYENYRVTEALLKSTGPGENND